VKSGIVNIKFDIIFIKQSAIVISSEARKPLNPQTAANSCYWLFVNKISIA